MVSNLEKTSEKGFIVLMILLCCFFQTVFSEQNDPLPSWKEGPAKKAIIQFVKDVTNKESPSFISQELRIATFDQDGTLWVEQPAYTQFFFAIERIKTLASQHPEWKDQEPFKSILEGKNDETFSEAEIEKIVAITHSGMSIDDYHAAVRQFLSTALHPRFKKPFTELIYQPMLEVLKFFKENGFTNYIVSGGGQEFIRSYALEVYDISPERVIGTTGKVKYEYVNGKPILLKLPEILFVDDKQGKPEGINLIIGKRPVVAFGNSDGDRQMLEWTQAGHGNKVRFLVHHDDAVREYAYDVNSKIGTFSKDLEEEAMKKGWVIISMKEDWLTIFNTNF